MPCAFLADSQSTERFALRLLLMDLNMEVAGEADDWSSLLARAPTTRAELLLVDSGLLSNEPVTALEELRDACPTALVMVLINHPDTRLQAEITSAGATFLCKDETPDHLVERLQAATKLLSIDC